MEKVKSKRFKPLVDAIKEIEKKVNKLPIDIEFAVNSKKIVNILQIRHISTRKNWKIIDENKFNLELLKLKKNI